MKEIFPVLIVFVAVGVPLLIPIIAILTNHQRKMAELLHATQKGAENSEITQLRKEVCELKQMLHQQMISMDTLNHLQPLPSTEQKTPLEEKVGGAV